MGAPLSTLVPLRNKGFVHISADGHYQASPGAEDELLYVVWTDAGEVLQLSPAEFAARYHWQNDPGRVVLSGSPVVP